MFTYHLDGGLHDMVTTNANGELKFDPPVYEQRYATTLRIIEDPRWTKHFKKVVEFGCNEMRLLPLMRRIETLEHIIEVDIDELTLVCYQHRGVPLVSDYIRKRECPLRVEIFCGNMIDSVENLRNVDVVIALEVIEHLVNDVLEKVPANVFGFIQPKLVIFSTPNREFNVLFNSLNANGFRIDDHKFEWTREEFRNWASAICEKYPNYSVAYLGIGSPPPNHKKLGHVTQIAIFARNDIIDRSLKAPIISNLPADLRPEVQYKEIYAIDFPYTVDERSIMQKIKDEAFNFVSRNQNVEIYHNRERCLHQIPIKYLNEYARTIDGSEEDVLTALKELNFEVENEYIILTETYVDENFRTRYCDLNEDEDDDDFLDSERYRYDDEIDGDLPPSIYADNDEPEESWD